MRCIRSYPNFIICATLILTALLVFWIPVFLQLTYNAHSEVESLFGNSWTVRLFINLLGYATVVTPGYLILLYVKKTNYLEHAGSSLISQLVQLCFYGKEDYMLLSFNENGSSNTADKNKRNIPVERSTSQEAWLLLFCFLGLQGSYLTWGVLQEKIMTRDYESQDGKIARFSDSQFLVFVNRILAFILSGTYILCSHQPRHTAPLYKYSYCSFSNIMSSWCQYEALKFVNFPTQVLAKASKIIPVMIMGKIVSKKTYEYYEYLTAIIISAGMAMFLLGSTEEHRKTTVTTFSGVFILIGYMAFDSFTSNWQSELFSQHKMSSVQMMCGVNLFSVILTSVSLIQQGGFVASVIFMLTYKKFILDIILLSLCSAMGQLFIFYTISQFGPVVFIIIMTIRQGLAILLSCIIYNHAISSIGIVGIILVFAAIFIRIYCNQRIKALRRQKLGSAV